MNKLSYPASTTYIKNGGLEQAILEAVNQDGLLSENDQKRLEELKSLPQNRTEVIDNNGGWTIKPYTNI